MVPRPVAVLALVLVVGCASAPTAVPELAPADSDPVVKELTYEEYKGPKIRVAVGEFEELAATRKLFDELKWPALAPLLTEQITTGLIRSGRVKVLERKQLGKLIGNMELEKSSAKSAYFDQKTTADKGKFVGAQAVLVGAITEFEPNVSGGDAGLSVAHLGGLKYHEEKAVIGIDVRLVDQETGEAIYAAHAKGEIRTNQVWGGVSYSGLEVGGGAWSKTPVGLATRQAANNAIRSLIKGLQALPFEAGVLDVKGDKVFIDGGRELNLKKGDRFRIVHRGDAITGPDGAVMGYDETEGGWVEVSIVQKKMSVAKVARGDPPKKGDVVRGADSGATGGGS